MYKYLIIIPLISILNVLCCKEGDPENPPNIVLFLVDDLGWQDTSVPFWDKPTDLNKKYHTPNMERLAAQGVKFTDAYATPVCSPSRVSLMTGMNAARHRVTNWTLQQNEMKSRELNHEDLIFPEWNTNGLSTDENIPNAVHATPLPQVLKDHGYFTIHAGKAHLGAIGLPSENPLNLGFDINIAGHAAGAPGSYHGTDNFGNLPGREDRPWNVPGLEKYHGQDIFLTEALTREALQAVEKSITSSTPFFLYMSLYAVHTPIMADKRFVQKYYDIGLDSIEARYASMVESMDKSLGDIMDALEKNGLSDNTIILFMSDNGGLSAHARGGEKHLHNSPLKSGKGSIYEGGIREPMIVKWPGVAREGTIINRPLIIEDFYPTILEMAQIDNYEKVQVVDGESFTGFFEEKALAEVERSLVWHYPNQWGGNGPGIGAYSAIRKGDWKLIFSMENEKIELYNLKDDIGEQVDLSQVNSKKTEELSKDLSEYLRSVDAQMPSYRISGNPVALADGSQ
tara:strand:- start:572 stop:2107 length:1536 start_codon:yes stop_codon:yes gene_type:complete